jgi:DNA-binding response OmpR family regulator
MNPNNGRVLIVEDEAIVAMEIELELENKGFFVVGKATKGEQAIEYAKMRVPDIVLMDINLKGDMDGITASEELLQYINVPILFISALTDGNTEARIGKIPRSHFLSKPFTVFELSEKIKRALL